MIVAIEAIDAGGGATQAEAIYQHMKQSRADVRKHDFPHYQTVAGGVVGRILRGETLIATREQMMQHRDDNITMMGDDIAKQWSRDKAVIIQSVMVADRLEWLPMLIQYAQEPDNLLILDRYKMSGVAYGAGDGLEANWVQTVLSCLPDADLNVLLDVTVNESMERRPERRDFYEMDLPKLRLVRETYLSAFSMAGDDYLIFDGSQPACDLRDEIVDAIWRKIEALKSGQS